MYTVTVEAPGSPEGELLEVLHLGLFPNGSTNEVSAEQVQVWELFSNKTWPEGGNLNTSHHDVLPPVEDTEGDPVLPDPVLTLEPEPVFVPEPEEDN